MSSRAETKPIDESEFPAMYLSADRNSLRGQRRFLTGVRVRLVALVIAAGFGGFTITVDGADAAGIGSAVAFGCALMTELYLLKARPDRAWYDGRAAAESTKTLTWRFIVGGAPFGKDKARELEAERRLLARFEEIAGDLRGIHLLPIARQRRQITSEMRRIRELSLEERRRQYRVGRIDNQRDWYASKGRWNERRATAWAIALACLEALGLAGAILKAVGLVEINLLGLAGALVAAGAAWIQTKQYQTIASAYAVAAQELASIGTRIEWASSEAEWSHFVDQAEEAISREHTLWRASHS